MAPGYIFMFRTVDRDWNGVITREEFEANAWQNAAQPKVSFDDLDTNGDGVLSIKEFTRRMIQSGSTTFDNLAPSDKELDFFLMVLDQIHEGQVLEVKQEKKESLLKGAQALASQFAQMDTNADGFYSYDEAVANMGPGANLSEDDLAQLRKEIGAMDTDGGASGGDGAPPRPPSPSPSVARARADNKVSFSEFATAVAVTELSRGDIQLSDDDIAFIVKQAAEDLAKLRHCKMMSTFG